MWRCLPGPEAATTWWGEGRGTLSLIARSEHIWSPFQPLGWKLLQHLPTELRLVQRVEKLMLELAGCKHQNSLLRLNLAHIGQSHTVYPEILGDEKQLEQRNTLILKVLSISMASSGSTDFWIPQENHKPLSQMLYNLNINKSSRWWKYLGVSVFGFGLKKTEINMLGKFPTNGNLPPHWQHNCSASLSSCQVVYGCRATHFSL